MRFAAFRYYTDISYPDFYYAWLQLSVSKSGKQVKIHDWAFNTQLNGNLAAGQTQKISNNIDSDAILIRMTSQLQEFSLTEVTFIFNNQVKARLWKSRFLMQQVNYC